MRRVRSTTRRANPRISNLQAAAIGIVLVAIVCYLVFGGSLPFSKSPFVLRAVFTANTNLHVPSPVRIAGVDVGEVTAVQRIPHSDSAGIVTMQINQSGLPIHADATVKIRSRLFLEGNFYVDLHPGSPGARVLRSGSTLPAANTAGPVQLDRVLSSLTGNARSNLQRLLQGLGSALNGRSTAADQAGQSKAVRKLTGAQGLNYSLKYSAKAFEGSAIVNQALLGTRPHDLSGAVRGESQVFRGLAASGSQLSALVVSFDRTMAALAGKQQALSQTIGILPTLLRSTVAADNALSASFGPTQRFAADIIPGLRELDPTIQVTLPWIKELTKLVSQPQLGGIVAKLRPAVNNSSVALQGTRKLVNEAGRLAKCFSKVVIPTGNETITIDPSDNAGLKIYQEMLQSGVGIAGSSQNFDGNGRFGRASVGGGSNLIKTPNTAQGPLYGNSVFGQSSLHTLPAFPSGGSAPAINSSVPCLRQSAPNLNSAKQGAGP